MCKIMPDKIECKILLRESVKRESKYSLRCVNCGLGPCLADRLHISTYGDVFKDAYSKDSNGNKIYTCEHCRQNVGPCEIPGGAEMRAVNESVCRLGVLLGKEVWIKSRGYKAILSKLHIYSPIVRVTWEVNSDHMYQKPQTIDMAVKANDIAEVPK